MGFVAQTDAQTDALIGGGAVAAITAIGGLLTVIGVLLKQRRDHLLAIKEAETRAGQQQRADAVREWEEFSERLQNRVATLEAELKAREKEWFTILRKCDDDIRTAIVAHHLCEREVVELKAAVRALEASEQRRQEQAGSHAIPENLPGVVIADIEGKILEFTPALTAILGWLPKEVRGKNVALFVPERLKDRHEAGMKNVAAGHIPWSEKSIITHAAHKDGREILVKVTLLAIKTGAQTILSATIKKLPPGAEEVVEMHGLKEG